MYPPIVDSWVSGGVQRTATTVWNGTETREHQEARHAVFHAALLEAFPEDPPE